MANHPAWEISQGLNCGSMTTKVFLTPAPIALLESQPQSLIALVPNSMVSELQQDRDEQLQHVLESVQQRGGHSLPTPWMPHDEHCHAIPLQWSHDTRPHLLDSECQPFSPTQIDLEDAGPVRLAMQQKPYMQQDGMACGTVLRLIGIQYCSPSRTPREPRFEDVAELFRQGISNSSTGEILLRSQFVASFL
tara:strand:+ start:417 stop:992 length:576 start_codon:yes stop_codon:yes gene_type:complete